MTLVEYVENLVNFLKENENLKDATVIYAGDDEGNGYQRVHYSPAEGIALEDGYDLDFIHKNDEETYNEYKDEPTAKMAVCIN